MQSNYYRSVYGGLLGRVSIFSCLQKLIFSKKNTIFYNKKLLDGPMRSAYLVHRMMDYSMWAKRDIIWINSKIFYSQKSPFAVSWLRGYQSLSNERKKKFIGTFQDIKPLLQSKYALVFHIKRGLFSNRPLYWITTCEWSPLDGWIFAWKSLGISTFCSSSTLVKETN